MAEKTDVLQFMMVRAPGTLDPVTSQRSYIRDDLVSPKGRMDTDLFSVESDSAIGKLVYAKVFCEDNHVRLDVREMLEARNAGSILRAVLNMLTIYEPPCPNVLEQDSVRLEVLQERTYFSWAGRFYLVPDQLQEITAPLAGILPEAVELLNAAVSASPPAGLLDAEQLRKALEKVVDRVLYTMVFDNRGYSTAFAQTKRALFDRLYLLYILRRRVNLTLEHIIQGLRTLHTLEALAIDSFVAKLQRQGQAQPDDQGLFGILKGILPALKTWDFGRLPRGMPLISRTDELATYFSAVPVVHPIFARLYRFKQAFNPIKPVGIGDLKVVKQWLCGYKVGEIAHIDNIMLREAKARVHRRLEKTEETFSLSSERQEETQRDTQSTDRFELKREADSIIKSDLSINAGLNVNVNYQGTGYAIVSTVTGGFAYARSQTEQNKVAANFAREVVDKAVKRVQSRTTEQRTITKLFETEETNTHTLDNKQGQGHVSGIYRWVDKEYRAQLFNYGKRMMFEFILPEPAAFLVESRLRAFEAALEVPQPPRKPKEVDLPNSVRQLAAAAINEQKFNELRQQYDLAEFTFPTVTKRVEFVDSATGKNYFSERGMDSTTWQGRNYSCRLDAKDYRITKLGMSGFVYFWGRQGLSTDANPPGPNDINTLEVYVAGQRLVREVNNNLERWYFDSSENAIANAAPFEQDEVTLFLGFWDIAQFDLSFHAELQLSDKALADWQTRVLNKIRATEQKKADDQNRELGACPRNGSHGSQKGSAASLCAPVQPQTGG